MEELLFRLMEFGIELAVATAAVTLVVTCLSIAILYTSGGYKKKVATVIIPVILSIIIGATGPEDHTSLRQWAYYTLPGMLFASFSVAMLCYYKRIREKA